MRKFVVLATVCAGTLLFATPESAKADHYRSGYGGGYGAGYGSSYGGGYGGSYGGQGVYGGVRSSPYGVGSSYCPHDSYGGTYGGSYGSRYIDPYHGVRLRNQAYDRHNVILRSGNFGFYYGR